MALTYREDFDSKIPAIPVLRALGWKYLGRDETVALRDGGLDQVVLPGVLPCVAGPPERGVKG